MSGPEIVLSVIAGLGANLFIGCVVLCAVDRDNELFDWIMAAPYGLGFVVLQLWPITAIAYRWPRRDEK